MPKPSASRHFAARPRSARRRGTGNTLIGIFIGLVLGLALAASIAYYLLGGRSAYQAQVTTNKDVREPTRESTKAAAADKAADKPRFDFYKILPGGEDPKIQAEKKTPDKPDRTVVDKAALKSAETSVKPGDKTAERAPEKVAMAEPSKATKPGDRFWLQAGSFSQEADAENLKAQLALAGWEAAVQSGMMPDKAVRYRVRLGPYDNTDELNRVKTQLAQRGFDVAVIKF